MADVSLEAQRIDGRAGARRSGKMATSAGENAEPAGKVTVRFVREVRRTRALSITASLTRVRMTSSSHDRVSDTRVLAARASRAPDAGRTFRREIVPSGCRHLLPSPPLTLPASPRHSRSGCETNLADPSLGGVETRPPSRRERRRLPRTLSSSRCVSCWTSRRAPREMGFSSVARFHLKLRARPTRRASVPTAESLPDLTRGLDVFAAGVSGGDDARALRSRAN